VYKGEAFLGDALRSIQAQTHRDWEAILSLDGPDAACESICRPFLSDSRFRLVVHRERLGWVGQANWLLTQAASDFWYYHQQDDLTEPTYLEVLLDHARRHPEAALVYCDLVPMGRIEGRFEQAASITGATAYIRLMTFLHEHFNAYAFRGVTRVGAVRRSGPLPVNDTLNFGADMTWLAGVTLSGEIHRVPLELYRKRYHDANTESAWWAWGRSDRLRAWPAHCVDIARRALQLETTVSEARLLWLAAVERLTSHVAAHFLPLDNLTDGEREQLFADFIERAKASDEPNVPQLLDADWGAIEAMSRSLFEDGRSATVEILGYGPTSVRRGTSFNVQPNGRSALWVRTSRRAFPDMSIRLAGQRLETYRQGAVLTAVVPEELLARRGSLELVLVGRDGGTRSAPVAIEVS
jgi:glycosyltransferase involved in cell wall biosynthesis